jgi:hypothetical protein
LVPLLLVFSSRLVAENQAGANALFTLLWDACDS